MFGWVRETSLSEDYANTLPHWATYVEDTNVINIDPDLAYPEMFKELGVNDGDVDQYWVEVAYNFTRYHIYKAIYNNERLDPRMRGMPLKLRILGNDGRKGRWMFENYPEGKGVAAANEGREAAAHFKRLYGYVPQ